jgi:hypothetical protein
MVDPSKLIAGARALYVTHKLTISDDPKWARERKEVRESLKQMGHDIKAGWHEACRAVEFDRANPKPAVRIPLWKGCAWIFLPILAVQLVSGLLPDQNDLLAYKLVWFLMAWLAGSALTVFWLNRASRAALREWGARRERFVSSR